MIDLIDEALETFLRDQASIDSTIGLSFDAPNAEWTAALTGPAINVFLWRIDRDQRRTSSGLRQTQLDGSAQSVVPTSEIDAELFCFGPCSKT